VALELYLHALIGLQDLSIVLNALTSSIRDCGGVKIKIDGAEGAFALGKRDISSGKAPFTLGVQVSFGQTLAFSGFRAFFPFAEHRTSTKEQAGYDEERKSFSHRAPFQIRE
jgi:hypothetical protein